MVSENSVFVPRQTGFGRKPGHRRGFHHNIHGGAVADGGCAHQRADFQADGVRARIRKRMGNSRFKGGVTLCRCSVAKIPVPLGDDAVAGADVGKGHSLVLAQQALGTHGSGYQAGGTGNGIGMRVCAAVGIDNGERGEVLARSVVFMRACCCG